MNNFQGKTPFIRLLLPVIIAIVLCRYTAIETSCALISVIVGLTAMLISFFLKSGNQYSFRWVFGAGLYLVIFGITSISFVQQDRFSEYNFEPGKQLYIGTVTDIPETKPKTIACNLLLSHPEAKKIVVYLQKSDNARALNPGDEIVFYAAINRFKNFEVSGDFDYPRYMKSKGFSGTSYIRESEWQSTGRENLTIPVMSQRFRKTSLEFYKSFHLSNDAYAFISALTLGYKSDLSDNLQEAFRASGTSHVLAVSGLHVGIIYLVINMLFSFMGKRGITYRIRQVLIIAVLWWYVFVAGMSSSVIRAAIMLTINCIGNMVGRKGFTYNTLASAAFFILIYKPFSLFDISFQMSFGAVFAILYFQPGLSRLYLPKNRITKELWNSSTVSLAAQLGVFPLVLYYFGTFPVYFFISNLLVVPLVSFIIYSGVPLIIVKLIAPLQPSLFILIQSIFQWITKSLTDITLRIVYITESLPYAQISNLYITTVQLTLLLIFVYATFRWFFAGKSRPLVVSLISLLLLIITYTHEHFVVIQAQI